MLFEIVFGFVVWLMLAVIVGMGIGRFIRVAEAVEPTPRHRVNSGGYGNSTHKRAA